MGTVQFFCYVGIEILISYQMLTGYKSLDLNRLKLMATLINFKNADDF